MKIEELETILQFNNIHYTIKSYGETFEAAHRRHKSLVTTCKINKGVNWLKQNPTLFGQISLIEFNK